MSNLRALGIAIVGVLCLGACSNALDGASASDGGGAGITREVGALLGTSPVGEIIVGPDGRALYGFTNDTQAASTCYGTCAEAWPPVIVPDNWTVGPGLDTGIFATTVRDDGQLQLVAGKWPLYYFAGDGAPGDINGQASGDVWFVVNPAGTLVTTVDFADAPAIGLPGDDGAPTGDEATDARTVTTALSELGTVLADGDGQTLYIYSNDVDGIPTCYDDCAEAWPPLLDVDGQLDEGLDPAVYSLIERDDGTSQLRADGRPLYRFAGDVGPGDRNGHGSGQVWWVVDANGAPIGEPEPTGPTATTAPPNEQTSEGGVDY